MNLGLFIARRIFWNGDGERKVSRPAIRIATLGVAIGLAVMIVSVAVVIGFKHTIQDKVTGLSTHMQIENYLSANSTDPYPIVIDKDVMMKASKVRGVDHVQRYALTQGLLKTNEDFLGVCFKGIAEEYDTTFLSKNMVEGSIPRFGTDENKYKLLISKYMAQKLQLKVGDGVMAYFMGSDVRMRKFTVSGIYCSHMTKYDELYCYTSLGTCVRLNEWEEGMCTAAEITVTSYDSIDITAKRVKRIIDGEVDQYGQTYSLRTIFEISPQVFSWLSLLDLNVWIILGLMICVASVTMISGLLIIILERTQMIGTLKAMGARNGSVQRIFLWFAVLIIGRGLILGNVIALALVWAQERWQLVTLDPQTYYVEAVPMEINVLYTIIINIATLILSTLILIIPSYLVSHIHPAQSMRYE